MEVKGNVVLHGMPAPGSDQQLRTAVARFLDGKLGMPVYNEAKHQTEFDLPLSVMGGVLGGS